MSEVFITKSAVETTKLGEKIGKSLKGGDLVLLTGELGGGKTQFTKGMAKSLGITETVVSPTFTIERVYPSPRHSRGGGNLVLHHFDLYRTHEDREMLEQIKEFTGSPVDVTVVEWPENLSALSGFNHTLINFEYLDDDSRKIEIDRRGDSWS